MMQCLRVVHMHDSLKKTKVFFLFLQQKVEYQALTTASSPVTFKGGEEQKKILSQARKE